MFFLSSVNLSFCPVLLLFSFSLKNFFNISCKAGIQPTDALRLCLFEKISIFFTFEGGFSGYNIIGRWVFFSFSINTLNISPYSFPVCMVSEKKSDITHVFFNFIFFISWRLITLQYCSGFCHTLTWISHGFTCVPHPDSPSHLPLHPIPLGLPSAPGPSTCLMHPTWAGDLFHPR